MNLTKYVSIGCLLLFLTGCNQAPLFTLEQVPQEYRSCAVEAVPKLKDGPITQKELIQAYAKLKRYAHRQNRCFRGLIKWADAQHSAYYKVYN